MNLGSNKTEKTEGENKRKKLLKKVKYAMQVLTLMK